jgi:hypothetical protein
LTLVSLLEIVSELFDSGNKNHSHLKLQPSKTRIEIIYHITFIVKRRSHDGKLTAIKRTFRATLIFEDAATSRQLCFGNKLLEGTAIATGITANVPFRARTNYA